jgi:uncharacterized DUF497 family protein
MRFEWDENKNRRNLRKMMFALKLPFSFSTIRTPLHNLTARMTTRNAG